MPIIIAIIIVIILVEISWSWHNLGNIEKNKKVGVIVISTIIFAVITFINFNISTNGIPYSSNEQMETVRNVLVLLFTFINGLIVMPSVSKVFGKIGDKQIKKKSAKKKLIIITVIFVIVLFFECNYMKGIQQDILKIYNEALQNK